MSVDLTFIGQIVVFLALVWLLRKYLYGPMNDLLQKRAERIAEGLAAADAGLDAREKAEKAIAAQLEETRLRAQEIIAAAEKRAAEVREEEINRARNEAASIVDSAREEVQAEAQRARQALRKEVAGLAILAAERVLAAELDVKRHRKLIEDAIQGGAH